MKDPLVLDIDQVVTRLAEFNAVLDARSPSEFAEDHLPGAVSAAVLDDAERARVGTVHAEDGAFAAKRLGAPLVARRIADLIAGPFAQCAAHWRPLVYCWRGGNRSGALATVLARVGWRTAVLDGGYRAFRRRVVDDLASAPAQLRMVVVGGRTGTAKSRILERLAQRGEQVLDLERLAAHRGSLLGGLPDRAQPTQKAFETAIWDALRGVDPARPVFIESESRKVGQLQVPEGLIVPMRASPLVIVQADAAVRSRFLLDEYAHFRDDVPGLHALLARLVPLHGSTRVAEWAALLDSGRWLDLVERLLTEHYDPSYDRSMRRNFGRLDEAQQITLAGPDPASIDAVADAVAGLGGTAQR